MSAITVTGLGSGLDYQSWIDALVAVKQDKIDTVSSKVSDTTTKESTLTAVKSVYSSLLSSLESFTTSTSLNSVFNQKTASSSSSAISADVSSYAEAQTVKVSVAQLATSTVAQSASPAAAAINSSTLISDIAAGSVTDGDFSIYVDNTKYSINVDSTSTLGDVLNSITSAAGLNATVDSEGKVTIGEGSTANIVVGSTADTSNLANVLSLTQNEDGSYTSSKSIFTTDASEVLSSADFANGNVTSGTFTIGSAEFTIDSTTTLNSIIKEINNNSDAGVSASWDPNSGKLVLEALEGGASNINIETGTSNFTDIMGLTSSSNLAEGSQTIGQNAILTINSTTITSSSNTVTSDISGITGLTLTLNAETSSTENVIISNDPQEAVSAIESFVSAFNSVISTTDSATSSSGTLYGESVLRSIKQSLRSTATDKVNGIESYNTLASIGITSGPVSTNVSANTSQLVIDSDKLTAALQDNPDAVITLLTGDSSSGVSGVFNKLDTKISSVLDPISGYFTTRSDSYEEQISRLNNQIDSMTLSLEKYQLQLEAKFSAMDTLISNLENSAAVFDSYFSTSTDSTSSD
jgi:flagellar hook-associated protein 2